MAKRIDTDDAIQQIQILLNNPLLGRSQAVQQIQGILDLAHDVTGALSSIQGLLKGNISNIANTLSTIKGLADSAPVSQPSKVVGFSEVRAMLAPHLETIKTVKVKPSGAKRGGDTPTMTTAGVPLPPQRPSTTGLLIKRTGLVEGKVTGGNLDIVLEGGDAGWEGALSNSNVDTYYTRAQITMVTSICKFLIVYGPSMTIESDGIDIGF